MLFSISDLQFFEVKKFLLASLLTFLKLFSRKLGVVLRHPVLIWKPLNWRTFVEAVLSCFKRFNWIQLNFYLESRFFSTCCFFQSCFSQSLSVFTVPSLADCRACYVEDPRRSSDGLLHIFHGIILTCSLKVENLSFPSSFKTSFFPRLPVLLLLSIF